MKLIKIEVEGFKSFAERIVLNFDGGIVGIVGPNGSGKSNINDAIRWVLGEQSSKSLRGDSMEDVIFSGSKTIKAVDRAEVSLTFDNSDHKVNIPGDKIVISRVLVRGKGSTYYINGEVGKLKDIKTITMETGISKTSLAIISQGTISQIAQASPEERRAIFEEAAGTSQYKSRKNEALKKLERTTEALEKMQTIISELKKQLTPLEKQAEKAQIYLNKTDKLKDVEIALIAKNIVYYQEILQKLSNDLKTLNLQKEQYEEEINLLENQIDSQTSYKLKLENEVIELQNQLDHISEKIINYETTSSKEEHARKMIISGDIKKSNQEQLTAMKTELNILGSKVKQYQIWDQKLNEKTQKQREQITSESKLLNHLQSEKTLLQKEIYKNHSRIEVMNDYKTNKSNLFLGTKTILNNKNLFNGIYDIVANLISVDHQYQTAVESILQNSLQNIVVADSLAAVKAVNFLKKNQGGRATFIPLSSIQPKTIRQEYLLAADGQEKFVGVAADLIKTEPKFNILKEFLLGNIFVAEDINSANDISRIIDKRYMVVTLEGDIIRAGGVISGGQKAHDRKMLNLDLQIQHLNNHLIELEKKLAILEVQTAAKNNALDEQQALISEMYIEQAKIKEKLELTLDSFTTLKITYESKTDEKVDISDYQSLKIDISELQQNKGTIDQQLKVKRAKIQTINQELSTANLKKTASEKLHRVLLQDYSKKITDENKANFYVTNSLQRLSETYEVTVDYAIDNYKLKIPIEKAEKIVSTLRQEIKALGYVNIDSINQYQEVKTRYEKFQKNESELNQAQQVILTAVAEMDQVIIVKFEKTIRGIQTFLQDIFAKMFGGGEIQLRYTDPHNILETGIDVVAQPPGKSVRNLKLFSGGEKSLIAISILFAILKYKPLPLCILDEVEAALDESNVVRYADFLQELKAKTQFLIITHRIGTMEKVDHLFGVTMQQRGVTAIFTVRLDKVKRLLSEDNSK